MQKLRRHRKACQLTGAGSPGTNLVTFFEQQFWDEFVDHREAGFEILVGFPGGLEHEALKNRDQQTRRGRGIELLSEDASFLPPPNDAHQRAACQSHALQYPRFDALVAQRLCPALQTYAEAVGV